MQSQTNFQIPVPNTGNHSEDQRGILNGRLVSIGSTECREFLELLRRHEWYRKVHTLHSHFDHHPLINLNEKFNRNSEKLSATLKSHHQYSPTMINSLFLIKLGSSALIFFVASSTRSAWCSIPTTIFSRFVAFRFARAKQAVKYPEPLPTSNALPPCLNFSISNSSAYAC